MLLTALSILLLTLQKQLNGSFVSAVWKQRQNSASASLTLPLTLLLTLLLQDIIKSLQEYFWHLNENIRQTILKAIIEVSEDNNYNQSVPDTSNHSSTT